MDQVQSVEVMKVSLLIEPSIQFDATNDILIDVEIIHITIVCHLTSN